MRMPGCLFVVLDYFNVVISFAGDRFSGTEVVACREVSVRLDA